VFFDQVVQRNSARPSEKDSRPCACSTDFMCPLIEIHSTVFALRRIRLTNTDAAKNLKWSSGSTTFCV